MLSLSAGKIKASARARDQNLEITETLYSQTNQVIRKALEGHKHLTREELANELEKAKIKVDSSRLVHFLMRAEVDAVVCSGAIRGKAHTYALLDERVSPTQALCKEEALAKLAQLYFTSHCPATLADFAWWSGLSLTEAKTGLEAVKPDFIAEKIDGQTYWLSRLYNNVPPVNTSAWLLPAFDEYLISYRDRKAAISSENQNKAISSNGIFRPTIVANGQIIGLWKKSAVKSVPFLFDFFEQPDMATQNLVNQAAEVFCTFLQNTHSRVSG
jgi:hypothetical protein